MIRNLMPTLAFAAAAALSVHCGSDPLEIVGVWTSNFGGTETISETEWKSSFGGTDTISSVVEFDNAKNTAYTQNAATAMFGPNKFNKTVWTEPVSGSFYYCTVAFNLDTLDKARTSTQAADASDPAKKGCSGFSWTQLTRM